MINYLKQSVGMEWNATWWCTSTTVTTTIGFKCGRYPDWKDDAWPTDFFFLHWTKYCSSAENKEWAMTADCTVAWYIAHPEDHGMALARCTISTGSYCYLFDGNGKKCLGGGFTPTEPCGGRKSFYLRRRIASKKDAEQGIPLRTHGACYNFCFTRCHERCKRPGACFKVCFCRCRRRCRRRKELNHKCKHDFERNGYGYSWTQIDGYGFETTIPAKKQSKPKCHELTQPDDVGYSSSLLQTPKQKDSLLQTTGSSFKKCLNSKGIGVWLPKGEAGAKRLAHQKHLATHSEAPWARSMASLSPYMAELPCAPFQSSDLYA